MTLQYIEEPHRHKILYNGRLLTAYNKTQLQFGDFGKPVHTLAGLPVMTTGAANFHHHNYPPLAPYGSFPYGDIGVVELSVQCDGRQVVIKSRNDWTNTYDSFKRGTGRAAGSHRSDRGGNEAVQAPDEQHRIWRCHE